MIKITDKNSKSEVGMVLDYELSSFAKATEDAVDYGLISDF